MYWRPVTQIVSFLPFGGVGAVVEAVSTPSASWRPSAPLFGGFWIDAELREGDGGEHDEDQRGADRPGDLQARVAVDLRGDAALLGAELDQRVEQRALDDHEHDDRDVEDDLVERVDLVGVRRPTRFRGEEVGERAAGEDERAGRREQQGRDEAAAEGGSSGRKAARILLTSGGAPRHRSVRARLSSALLNAAGRFCRNAVDALDEVARRAPAPAGSPPRARAAPASAAYSPRVELALGAGVGARRAGGEPRDERVGGGAAARRRGGRALTSPHSSAFGAVRCARRASPSRSRAASPTRAGMKAEEPPSGTSPMFTNASRK